MELESHFQDTGTTREKRTEMNSDLKKIDIWWSRIEELKKHTYTGHKKC